MCRALRRPYAPHCVPRLTGGNHGRFKRVRLARKGQTDRIQKSIFAERLQQAIHGSVCVHPGDYILITIGGDENNRDFGPLTHPAPAAARVRSSPACPRRGSESWFSPELSNSESCRPMKTPPRHSPET